MLAALSAICVSAIPMAFDIAERQLDKRHEGDTITTHILKSIVTLGALVLGGTIISRRAVNYYFQTKEEYDRQNSQVSSPTNNLTEKLEIIVQDI